MQLNSYQFINSPLEDNTLFHFPFFCLLYLLFLFFPSFILSFLGYLDADCIRRALGGEWTNDEIENMVILHKQKMRILDNNNRNTAKANFFILHVLYQQKTRS